MSRVQRRALAGLAAGLAVVVLAAALWTLWAYRSVHRPYAGWEGDHVDVDIPSGMTAGEMLERLADAGVIHHPHLTRLWLRLAGVAPSLQAGEYRFAEPVSAVSVLRRLERGDVLLHPVTVREGLDLAQTARALSDAGFSSLDALLDAFGDPSPVAPLDPAARDLEGYLFPETYLFPKDVDASTIARTMVARFRESVGPEYETRAAAAGLTLREAVTLGSMIEMETSLPEERTRISRVFHNRLERSMRMQCDPTVVYALKRAGRERERLTYRDLEFDSPWNTYVVAGLPPGPIASPGKASLEAAVSPAPGDDLYFVATPEGGHAFSETLEGHLEAVKVWRRYSRSSR